VPVTFDKTSNGASISYNLKLFPWTAATLELVYHLTEQFAQSHDDLHSMELRHLLGMATQLLGDPAGRQRKVPDAALILYAEGMYWLDAFARGLGVT